MHAFCPPTDEEIVFTDVLVATASSQCQEDGICIFYQKASEPPAGCIATSKGISALLRCCSIDGDMIKCCLFMQRMHGLWAFVTLQLLPAATEVFVALQAGS